VPEPRWSLFGNRRLEAWRFESDKGGEAGGKESEVESEETRGLTELRRSLCAGLGFDTQRSESASGGESEIRESEEKSDEARLVPEHLREAGGESGCKESEVVVGGESESRESEVESDEARLMPEEESDEARFVLEPRWSLSGSLRLEAGGKESEVESKEA
jgi:hypothetical protein